MKRTEAQARRRGRAFSLESAPTLARVRGLLRTLAPELRRQMAYQNTKREWVDLIVFHDRPSRNPGTS